MSAALIAAASSSDLPLSSSVVAEAAAIAALQPNAWKVDATRSRIDPQHQLDRVAPPQGTERADGVGQQQHFGIARTDEVVVEPVEIAKHDQQLLPEVCLSFASTKRLAAAAFVLGIRVVEGKAGAFQAFDEVDRHTVQQRLRIRIDKHPDTGGFDHRIIISRSGVQTDQVLVAGAAAGLDHDPQSPLGLARPRHRGLDGIPGLFGQNDHDRLLALGPT
jgi:hypothetical protein